MPSFDKSFFENNRMRLMDILPDTFVVISAHTLMQYSADIAYPFRQESNFWYLTGINEPDLILIIDTKSRESTIVLPDRNEYQQQWDGEYETSEFESMSGIPNFIERSAFAGKLKQAKIAKKQVGYLKPLDEIVQPYGFYSNPSRRLLAGTIAQFIDNPVDIRLTIAKLRQIKQQDEIEAVQAAIDITATSLEFVKSRLQDYKNETDIERVLTTEFYKRGSEGHGYEPIIANGVNAAIIHYNKNNKPLQHNELILLDVGAKIDGYSADISRTWVYGESNDRQREIYDAVVQLQDRAFSILKPGVLLREYQQEMEKVALKLMKKLHCSTANEKYPHGFSHFLGVDVHDAGDYEAPLVEGMVLTVEPGIYLPDEGIGVRIEDNVLMTKNGIKNLSEKIPRNL